MTPGRAVRAKLRALVAGALLAWPAVAPAACKLSKIIDFPVLLHDRQPLLDAMVNGQPVRLMVDSGAFFSLISPGSAAELKLPLSPAPFGMRMTGVGGSADLSVATVKNFTVSGITLHHMDFLVGGSEIGSYGVIGQNFLGFRDAEYDLANGMVRLMDAVGCEHANLAYWAAGKSVAMVPMMTGPDAANHIVGTVKVNGVSLRTLFDTGAGASGLSLAGAARAGIHPGDKGVEAAGFSSGFGPHRVRAWIAPVDALDIGDEQIRHTRLRVVDYGDEGGKYDLILGADFFLAHHIYAANRQHMLFITYNGGQVFQLHDIQPTPPATLADVAAQIATLPGPAAEAAPGAGPALDAAGYARSGAAKRGRGDLAGARADLDQAVRAAPDEPRYRIERARVLAALRQRAAALADVDAALKQAPHSLEALLLRAELNLRRDDFADARADLDTVAATAPPSSDLRLELADLYSGLERHEEAIAQYTAWIGAHPVDSRMAGALNGRCWQRALADRELSAALADCNGALRRQHNAASLLDSRGLVYLRLGDNAHAIADYSRALLQNPRLAWSLWGRGLAKLRSGDVAGGQADLAAARAANPEMPVLAEHYGLAAPAAS